MTIGTVPFPQSEADTADKRWAQWSAKGVEQDRATHRRIVALAVVFAFGLAAWLALAGLLG